MEGQGGIVRFGDNIGNLRRREDRECRNHPKAINMLKAKTNCLPVRIFFSNLR
jgi:hypothetical protein